MTFLEIACFNPESALEANKAKVNRIEFCDGPEVGGTTPKILALSKIRDNVTVPIFVMIRPRGGDFVYTDGEFEQMKASINEMKKLADGFVFGILESSGKVDVTKNTELVKLAHPLPCTFHRAFDETSDKLTALESVIECGFHTILTSGGESSAIQGCDMITKLVQASGDRITILVGGGVRSTNIKDLQTRTKATHYHSSALVGEKTVADFDEMMLLKNKLEAGTSDP